MFRMIVHPLSIVRVSIPKNVILHLFRILYSYDDTLRTVDEGSTIGKVNLSLGLMRRIRCKDELKVLILMLRRVLLRKQKKEEIVVRRTLIIEAVSDVEVDLELIFCRVNYMMDFPFHFIIVTWIKGSIENNFINNKRTNTYTVYESYFLGLLNLRYFFHIFFHVTFSINFERRVPVKLHIGQKVGYKYICG